MSGVLGYLTFGWTPNGHYRPAVDNAPLLDGWEIITRLEGARAKPAETPAATFISITTGIHFEITPQLRIQIDAALQKLQRVRDHACHGERWCDAALRRALGDLAAVTTAAEPWLLR